MLIFTSKKKLVDERERLRLELEGKITECATAGFSFTKLSIEISPYTEKIVEIDQKLLRLSSKSELELERNELQGILDATRYITGTYSEEVSRRAMENRVSRIDQFLKYVGPQIMNFGNYETSRLFVWCLIALSIPVTIYIVVDFISKI